MTPRVRKAVGTSNQLRSGNSQVDEPACPPHRLHTHKIDGIKVTHFACDPAGVGRGVEPAYLCNGRLPANQGIPESLLPNAIGCDNTHPRDDDPSSHLL